MNVYLCVLSEGMRPPIKELKIKATSREEAEKQLIKLDEPAGHWIVYDYLIVG